MKLNKNLITTVVLAVCFIGISKNGFAATEDKGFKEKGMSFSGMMKPGNHDGSNKLIEALGLSEEQKLKIKEHKEQTRKKVKDITEQLKEKRELVKQEIGKADVNKETVYKIANEIKALQNQQVDLMVDGIFKMKETLTPEQYAKFVELAKQRNEQMKENWENRKGKENGQRRGPGMQEGMRQGMEHQGMMFE